MKECAGSNRRNSSSPVMPNELNTINTPCLRIRMGLVSMQAANQPDHCQDAINDENAQPKSE